MTTHTASPIETTVEKHIDSTSKLAHPLCPLAAMFISNSGISNPSPSGGGRIQSVPCVNCYPPLSMTAEQANEIFTAVCNGN